MPGRSVQGTEAASRRPEKPLKARIRNRLGSGTFRASSGVQPSRSAVRALHQARLWTRIHRRTLRPGGAPPSGHGGPATAGPEVVELQAERWPVRFQTFTERRPALDDDGEQERVRTGRIGPFWDGVAGRAPMPRAAATLGFEFVDADVARGTIDLAFAATEAFTNPAGNVLGAFVAAMLYDTLGPALLATLQPDQFQSTLDLNVHFLRPVRPGRLTGKGRVVHREGDIAFLE